MDEKNKIKNIIFDLGEVLFTGIKNTGLTLMEKHKIDEALVSGTPFSTSKTPLLVPLVQEFFNGNITEDEYIKAVLLQYPQFGTDEWLKDHIRENFREVEGTREIVIELKKLGYKTAILSVHGKEWIDYLEKKFNFHQLFDVVSFSYDERVSKPNPSAFQNVLQKLQAIPEECIFVDDADKNINAAESFGIKSILFVNAKDLRNRLKQTLPDF
jgi:HAD superfamily hydrolase (TIGR01549 family)